MLSDLDPIFGQDQHLHGLLQKRLDDIGTTITNFGESSVAISLMALTSPSGSFCECVSLVLVRTGITDNYPECTTMRRPYVRIFTSSQSYRANIHPSQADQVWWLQGQAR